MNRFPPMGADRQQQPSFSGGSAVTWKRGGAELLTSPLVTSSFGTSMAAAEGGERKHRAYSLLSVVVPWSCFLLTVVCLWKFFSDGTFSAVLTLCSGFECFAYLLLFTKVVSQKSVKGLSWRAFFLSVIALGCKLYVNLLFDGYVPLDSSGDWLYQTVDFFSLFILVLMLCLCRFHSHYKATLDRDLDTFPLYLPLLVSFVLALVVHSTRNANFVADTLWALSTYLEVFTQLPQLSLLVKKKGQVENLTGHYLASLSASRFFLFVFWLNRSSKLGVLPGWFVLGAIFTQNLIMADYMYHYVKAKITGKDVLLRRRTSLGV